VSTSIRLHCNRQWADGSCATVLITDARTREEARDAGRRAGWRIHPDGRDYCPGHSGTPAPASTVVPLYPDTPPEPTADGSRTALSPLETLHAAAQDLRALAAATDDEIAINPSWHSGLIQREHWFAHGITNAVGAPAGHLAALLSPANARLIAQSIERHTRTREPIPAETFLLARNIQRSPR